MQRPNFDPEYERIVRALRTVAALMVKSEHNRARYEPIFLRLQREKDQRNKTEPSLEDMLQDALTR